MGFGSARDVGDDCGEYTNQVGGRKTDVEAASAATHVHDVMQFSGLVDDGRQSSLLAEWRDAPGDVSSKSFSRLDLHHLSALAADSDRSTLEIELTCHWDDRDMRSAVDQEQQRLEHPIHGQAERFCSLQAVRGSGGVVGVAMFAEDDACGGKRSERGRCSGHVRKPISRVCLRRRSPNPARTGGE